MTKRTYRVSLQFPGREPVTGDWASWEAADRTYRGWVGLYGGDREDGVTLRLVERGDGERVVRSWPEDAGA